MVAPLSHIRVLELARVLAGPWAGQLLADLGADVVKIERPLRGDDTREWGPPFIEAGSGENLGAAYFHSCNRGKRGLTADFETEEGRALVRHLVAHADVLIENYKVGGLKKYGLDYDSLKAINPRLVYCSITGFGQDGPYAPRPGYDFLVQGLGGMMALTGPVEGPPEKAGLAIADLFTGLYAANAVQAALLRRDQTGEGAYIDCALLDTQVSLLSSQGLGYLVTGQAPHRMANAHSNIVPYDVFKASDGDFIIAGGNDSQFQHLCGLLGAPELASDQRFSTNPARVTHRDTLTVLLNELTRKHPRAEILAGLEHVGVPCASINTIPEVFVDPQVVARGMRVDLDHPRAKDGTIPSLRSPIVMDGERLYARRHAPDLGGDAAAVLSDPNWGGGRV